MAHIFKIFIRDVKSIVTHFVPLLICLSLIVIGSCYAIFNIFSNWDPYGNTGNLTILVYNDDKGYTQENGTYVNQGDAIVESLMENESINWVQADTKNALIEAVTTGSVYAGIVIDDDFTYNMLNFLSAEDGFTKPKIDYYENDKKNAIAIKVTDTAVDTLQSTINKTFLETVVKTVFEKTNEIVDDNDEKNEVELIVEKLNGINDNLMAYDAIITQFLDGNDEIHTQLNTAENGLSNLDKGINNSMDDIDEVKADIADTQVSYNEFSATMSTLLNDLEISLDTVSTDIDNSKLLTEDIDALNDSLNQTIADINGLYSSALSVNNEYDSETMKNFLSAIMTLNNSVASMQQVNIKAPDLSTLYQALDNCSNQVSQLKNTYNNTITPEINSVLNNMSMVLDNITNTMQTLSSLTGNAGTLFSNIDSTIGYTDQSLTQVQQVVEEISDKLNTVLEKVEAASDDEKMEILYNFLTGDAESYSKYFSQIIQIDTTTVFPVDNYGSACGVFYVVLALYVLALLLTSELKVDADVTGLKNVKSYETYFGRYLTFALIGLLQSVFLSAFCVWILKMQCEHVLAFFLVNAFISLVFTSITYSCVKTFGMIYGRTLATILVIFQMSTSGCTYSVEQIPTSMRWLNPYMPFTYCSNALREVCFGYTNYDLSIYLGKLLIFVAIALFFGLFVRIPMVKLIRFIDARLLDTGFMGVEEEAEEDEEDEDDEEDGDKEEYEEDEDENDRYEEMTDSKKEDEEDR